MIYRRIIMTMATIGFFALLCVNIADAGDLDDRISKYTDDGIAKYDELGKKSVNINFIIVKALSQKGQKKKDGDNNENSVVVEPGANVGDIYNIVLDSPGSGNKPKNKKK